MGVRSTGGRRALVTGAALLGALLAMGCEGLPLGGSPPTPTIAGAATAAPAPQEVRDVRPVVRETPALAGAASGVPPAGPGISPAGPAIPPASPRRFAIEVPPTATTRPSPTRAATATPTPARTPPASTPTAAGGQANPAASPPAAQPGAPTATQTAASTPTPPTGVRPAATGTPTPTPTGTSTWTPTATPVWSPTPVSVLTPLPTRTPRPTATPLPTATVPPTPTPPTPTPRAIGAPAPSPWPFINDVNAALDLLRTRSSQDFTLVSERIRDIIEVVPPLASERIWRVQVSTKTVWLSQGKMREWGENNVAIWTASVLVHLAFHVDLYDKFTEYMSCEAELRALERQREALGRLAAPTSILLFIDGLIAEGNCDAQPASEHVVP